MGQLVDCSKQNSGCNGGLMDYAFSYYRSTSIASESSYPYTARDGSCKSSYTTAIPRGGVTGYKDVSSSSSALMSALNQQPVSVAVQADQSAFQRYSGGIVTSGCGTNLDHGVLAAGYDSTQGYYLVKNSWGRSWGDAGYLKISTSGNVCGIHSQPSYPTVSGTVLGSTSDVDCTKATCQSQCECSLDKCASEIDTCMADAKCAASQNCAFACPCSDNACMLKCAAQNPSAKALPVATCVNSKCGSVAV